jgi:hypothetical protein
MSLKNQRARLEIGQFRASGAVLSEIIGAFRLEARKEAPGIKTPVRRNGMPQGRKEALDDWVCAALVCDTRAGRVARRAVAGRDSDRSRRRGAGVQQSIKLARGIKVLQSVFAITDRVMGEACCRRVLIGAAVGSHINIILRARRAVVVIATRMSSDRTKYVSATAGQGRDVVTAPRKPGGKHAALVDAVGRFHGRDHIIEERHVVAAAAIIPSDAVTFVINSLRENENRRGTCSRGVLNAVCYG